MDKMMPCRDTSYKNIPCKECLVLAICRQKERVKCFILGDFLTEFDTSYDYRVGWGGDFRDLLHQYLPKVRVIEERPLI